MTANLLVKDFCVPTERVYTFESDLLLESGEVLQNPSIAYQIWGTPNADQSNVIWVCHALTGNQRVHEWWSGLFGEGKCFDPTNDCIICANVIGSCYGSSGPLSYPSEELPAFGNFPFLSIRDLVKGHEILRKHLNINKIKLLIGASLGGQQALEWSTQQPELFESAIYIATNAKHSILGIGYNEAQRLAIQADPTFGMAVKNAGMKGMIAARSIAMLSYRSYEGFEISQKEFNHSKTDHFNISSYLQYQGKKLTKRFNAYSYWTLSKAMDSHNLSRNGISAEEKLNQLAFPVLIIGIQSDRLFPVSEQKFLNQHIQSSTLTIIESNFGHDGFLIEYDALSNAINDFIHSKSIK